MSMAIPSVSGPGGGGPPPRLCISMSLLPSGGLSSWSLQRSTVYFSSVKSAISPSAALLGGGLVGGARDRTG